MSKSLWPHELQHARLLCPSISPGVCSNSCPLRQWCHPTISSSVTPFSCSQSFPASGSFLISQFFALSGQSLGAAASVSVFLMNIESWFPLGLTGLISLLSKGQSPSLHDVKFHCHLPLDVSRLHDLDEWHLLLFEPAREGEILYDTSPPHICGNHNKQIVCNLFMQNAEFKLLTEIEISSTH